MQFGASTRDQAKTPLQRQARQRGGGEKDALYGRFSRFGGRRIATFWLLAADYCLILGFLGSFRTPEWGSRASPIRSMPRPNRRRRRWKADSPAGDDGLQSAKQRGDLVRGTVSL